MRLFSIPSIGESNKVIAVRRICLYISILALLIFLGSPAFSANALVGKVTSVEGQYVELNIGANQGITVGDTGRVFYTIKIQGKDKPIYIAKFKVTHISPRSCMAQIDVRTGDVKAGLSAEIMRVGDLEITSAPPGASLHINGKPAGVTPFEGKDYSAGPYRIRVEKEGYEAWEKQITVEAGRTSKVLADLAVLRVGELEVKSEPSGAKIYLDGKAAGDTPSVLSKVSPGRHRVQVSKDGYVPFEGTVEIRARERARIEASLKRATGGILVVTEPPGANVSVDGRRAGVSPYGGKGLTPRKYRVRVDKEGYETWEGEVTVIAEKDVEVPVALKLKGGELLVQSEPPGAKVYLTGKEIGSTPTKVSGIPPGVYELRVIKEGYAPHEAQVKVVGGRTETVQASLRKSAGSLLLRTEPAGANVYVDGKLAGVSPFQGEGLTPGAHRVQVSKEAYETQEKEVTIKVNERAEVSISLKRITGSLVIQTEPPGANIYVDGKSSGVSPHEAKELLPGIHRVRVVKEGYDAWEKEVTVEGGKKIEVRPQLAKVALPKSQESPPSPQTKVMPPKTEKPATLKPDAPIWSINDSWGYVNAEGKAWETRVVKIEGNFFIVKNTSDDSLLGIDKGTLQAKIYITAKGKMTRDTELGDFQFKFPLDINKEWNQMITAVSPLSHVPGNFSNSYRVIASEDITVRAGTFKAFKIELKQVHVSGMRADMSSKHAYIWYSPEIKKEVKVQYEGYGWGNKAKSYELTSHKLSRN